MTELATKDDFRNLFHARKKRMQASERVSDLTLGDLKNPEIAKKKINGSAVDVPDFCEPPNGRTQVQLERITGQSDIDVFSRNTADIDDMYRALENNRLQRIKAQILKDNMTVSETAAFRTVCCYRMVREFGRLRNLISSDVTLSDSDIFERPQTALSRREADDYCDYVIESTPEPYHKTRKKALRGIIQRIGQVESQIGRRLIPEPRRNPTGFEGEQAALCGIFREIADALYLIRGSSEMPDYGILGLPGLFDVETIGFIWPSRHEIMAFEELLIDEVIETFVKKGEMRAKRFLHSKYGFLKHEATELLHLAFRRTKDYVVNDTEIQRAKMVLRLEHLLEVATRDCDTRAQVQVVKTLAQVTGLFADNGEDEMDDFIRAMGKVASEQNQIEEVRSLE